MASRPPAEVLNGFLDEARGYLPAIREGLREALAAGERAGPTDADSRVVDPLVIDPLVEVHRLVHIIKGAASMVGLGGISHDANAIETVLDELIDTHGSHRDVIQHLLQGVDRLEVLLRDIVPDYGLHAATAIDSSLIDPEMLEVYTLEAEDHLRSITAGLVGLEAEPANRDTLQDVRRSVHTLKGAASVVGFKLVSGLAHRMEDLLDRMFDEQHPVTPEALKTLMASTEVLEGLGRSDSGAAVLAQLRTVESRLDLMLSAVPEPPVPEGVPLTAPEPLGVEAPIQIRSETVTPAASEEPGMRPGVRVVRVPLPRLDSLSKLASELVINRSVMEQRVRALEQEILELTHSSRRLKAVAHRIETDYEASTLGGMVYSAAPPASLTAAAGVGRSVARAAAPVASATHGFDALEFDRYTALHQLMRELTEAATDTGSVATELENFLADFDAILTRQRRLTSEIQDGLMRVRLLPLRVLATRLHRTVRVTADQERKQATFVLEGETMEMDTTVIDQIVDPLLHLLRNAVSHGIEPPEVRRRNGKPEQGTVHLRAFPEGTNLVLQIEDDGTGLDTEAIREKAIHLGLVTREQTALMSSAELHQIIFLPGFSTAQTISEVSGRGVGMDVVRDTVHKLQGSIAIDSEKGRRTTFTLRLPVTLTVARSLLVLVNGDTYAIPLSGVEQILRVEPSDIEHIVDERMLRLDGKTYPVVWLRDALNLPVRGGEPAGRLCVLIAHLGSGKAAVVVDRVLEGREIVIKPLGSHLRRVRGLLGSTILGDGRVIPIVNPTDLGERRSSTSQPLVIPGPAVRVLNVLVVDDSPSMRRINSALMQSQGWIASTAKDGLDALDKIQTAGRAPDVILLDVEMPRMDGYEFLASIRANPQYRDIPVVMITSRSGEKHRRKALDLGASEYMTKPYHDDVLIGHIHRLTTRAS